MRYSEWGEADDGAVAEWLERTPLALEVSGSRQFMYQLFQKFSGHPPGNGYRVSPGLGKVETACERGVTPPQLPIPYPHLSIN